MSLKLIPHFSQSIVIIIVICVNVANTAPITDDGQTSLTPQETLRLLKEEAEQTKYPFKQTKYPFKQAWDKSKYSYTQIRNQLREYKGILNEGEMRIIIAYTYEQPRFYKSLNTDIRDHFSDPRKQNYPQATRILSIAIKKLSEFQRKNGIKLPEVIYRKENKSIVLPVYRSLQKSGALGVLKQFTSTSRSKNKTLNTGSTLTTFHNPKVGADIHAFSKHDEEEFLLPYNVKYRVKFIRDGNATLEGPFNNGFRLEISYSFALFSFLVYIWLN